MAKRVRFLRSRTPKALCILKHTCPRCVYTTFCGQQFLFLVCLGGGLGDVSLFLEPGGVSSIKSTGFPSLSR
jgi:hypothetical protein